MLTETRAKNIDLTEGAIKALSIQAIEQGTNFKNYVEDILEDIAKSGKFPKVKAKKAIQ